MKEYFGYSLYSYYDMEKDLVDSEVDIMPWLIFWNFELCKELCYGCDHDLYLDLVVDLMVVIMILILVLNSKVRLDQPDSGLTEFWSRDLLPTAAAPKNNS